MDRTAGAIRGRAARVFHPVTSEMDNYEPGVYTEKVLEATKLLTNTGTTQTLCNETKNSNVFVSANRLCTYMQVICQVVEYSDVVVVS